MISAIIGAVGLVPVALGWRADGTVLVALGLCGLSVLHEPWHGRYWDAAFQRAYVSLLVVLLVLVAVIPAWLLFEDVHQQTAEALVKLRQLYHAQALQDRTRRFRKEWVDKGLPSWMKQEQLCDPRDVYPPFLSRQVQAVEKKMLSQPGIGRNVSAVIFSLLSTHGNPGELLELMVYDKASDEAWQWWRTEKQPEAPPSLNFDLNLHPGEKVLCASGALLIPPGTVPLSPLSMGPLWIALGGAGLLVLSGLVFWVVGSVARLVSLIDCDEFESLDERVNTSWDRIPVWLFSTPPDQTINGLLLRADAEVVDLLKITGPDECQQVAHWLEQRRFSPLIILDHLECRLFEHEWSAAVLLMLEALVFRHKGAVVMVSAVDPLYSLVVRISELRAEGTRIKQREAETQSKDSSEVGDESNTELLNRWIRVFDCFSKTHFVLPDDLNGMQGGRAADKLAEVLSAKEIKPMTVGAQTRGLAESRCWTIWSQCTKAEKLALRQLADEGFVNPKNREVVRHLGQRLLIRRGPALQMNPDFRRFVLQAESPQTIARWESEGAGSVWARLRDPFLIVLLVAAVFFLSTQRELYNNTLTLLAVFTTMIPAILKLFSVLGGQRDSAITRQ